MKTTLMILSLALISAPAFSQFEPGRTYPVMSCHDTKGVVDAGELLALKGEDGRPELVATFYHQSLAGPQEVGDVTVLQKVLSRPVKGSPVVYSGDNFKLTLFVDADYRTIEIPAHLKANFKGEQIDQDMLCVMFFHTL